MRVNHRWTLLLLTAAVLAGPLADGGFADDKKDDKTAPAAIERKDLEAVAYKTLRDVINHGADVYNAGDVSGCWRLYEGALMMLKPMLDHRPDLQKAIADGVAAAGENPQMDRRAWVLRVVIDKVRKEIDPNPKPAPAAKKTMWERLGGEDNVKKVIDDFVRLASDDEALDVTRGKKYLQKDEDVNKFKKNLRDMISTVADGPYKYNDRMKEAHAGMKITDAQFALAKKHLQTALEKNKVAAADVMTLMDVVERTRTDIVEKESTGKSSEKPKEVLWVRLGGADKVDIIVDDFWDVVKADTELDDFRRAFPDKEQVVALKDKLKKYISLVSAGPLKSEDSTKEAFVGKAVTDKEFDSLSKHLKAVLTKSAVKDADIDEFAKKMAATRADNVKK